MFGFSHIEFEWPEGEGWTLALLGVAGALVVIAASLLAWVLLAMALGVAL